MQPGNLPGLFAEQGLLAGRVGITRAFHEYAALIAQDDLAVIQFDDMHTHSWSPLLGTCR